MKRHALFVGVNTYDDPSIRPLRFSVPDASVLADRFGRLGFKTRLLPDPTGAELKSAVEDSVAGLGPGDVFLFFFAGHGFTAQDGAHLLFCKDDRQKLLRVNGAGVRVDALEALTDDGGFHRAFLLDSCRTDCLAGAGARGAATRDLDFVAMPASSAGSGSFFLLRSCDKFRPSLELDDLGHGLFTQGLLDAMEARDSRLAACDTSFASAIRDQMEVLQRRHHVMEPQRPSLGEVSGGGFALFQEGFLQTGRPLPAAPGAAVPALVECPVCGKMNRPEETFRCRECGRRNLCLRHQDEETFLCADCVRKAREEAEREAREEARRKAREEAEREAGTRRLVRVGDVEFALRWCPPGTFQMGSPTSEEGRFDGETRHRVTLTRGFWLGETQVTQGLWKEVMGGNPSFNQAGDDYPVENVSWDDCQTFIGKLNARAGVQGSGLRFALPTEAQWEYACRTGTTGDYGGTGRLDDMGWYWNNSGCGTHPVGEKEPNAWGFRDMHGNVFEWCADWYGDYPSGAVTDPTGPASGDDRVLRGGCYWIYPRFCRSALRFGSMPSARLRDHGLRLLALQDAP